jgi:hypothetical protein
MGNKYWRKVGRGKGTKGINESKIEGEGLRYERNHSSGFYTGG